MIITDEIFSLLPIKWNTFDFPLVCFKFLLVRGYTTTKNIANTSGVSGTLEQDTVRDLMTQKQALLMELKHYDSNNKFNEDVSKYEQNLDINLDVIPANTRLQISIIANEKKVSEK